MRRVVTHEELPADAGLSALGILMRFGGGLGLWVGIYALIILLMMSLGLGLVGLMALGVGRSYLHGRAGRALAAARPDGVRLAWGYVAVGLVHTVALVPFADDLPAAFSGLIYVVMGLSASWPLVVAGLLLRPSAKGVVAAMQERRRRIFAEDLGITGVAALMVAMGSVGMLLVAFWMVMMVQVGTLKAGFFGWLTLMIGAGFLVRSFLHTRSGLGQLRRFDPSAFRARNDQYFLVAMLTTGVVAVLMLFTAIQGGLAALLMIIPIVGLLMSWPNTVRDVGSVELRADLDEEDAPSIRPARDQGLVMLGMVLLAYGAFGACNSAVLFVLDVPELAELSGSPMGLPQTATWQSLLTTATSLWAGVELVAMSPRRKLATVANLGIVATMTVLSAIETFKVLEFFVDSPFGDRRMLQPQAIGTAVMQVIAPLALPVVATVQVLRRPTPVEVDVAEVF